ncbi:hypothetical protein BJX64DRAFT_271530 [Aspergillus heterothallicus]
MSFIMRLAEISDLEDILFIPRRRVEGLRSQESKQWTRSGIFRRRPENYISGGNTWLMMNDSEKETVATITVEFAGNAAYWTEKELQTSAQYISKMATAIHRAGKGMLKLLIEYREIMKFSPSGALFEVAASRVPGLPVHTHRVSGKKGSGKWMTQFTLGDTEMKLNCSHTWNCLTAKKRRIPETHTSVV